MATTDRSARRAALRATHPDLGGDADDFIAVMRALDGPAVPRAAVAPVKAMAVITIQRSSPPFGPMTMRASAAQLAAAPISGAPTSQWSGRAVRLVSHATRRLVTSAGMAPRM